MSSIAAEKYHLLLVEDNEVNQKLAAKLLEKMGYMVDVASNGQEAIECCATHTYDLVLMDCQMPVMDGFEATHAIRDSQNKIPIIAMTGSASDSDRMLCLNAGMNDYVSKPIKFTLLDEMIKKWLPNTSSASTIESNNN